MFTQLIEGVRELRVPLLTGYSVIISFWLAVGDRLPASDDVSPQAERISHLWSQLGTGSQAAAVTFAAYLLGSFTLNLGHQRLLAWLGAINDPGWEAFIREAENRVVTYEEYEVEVATAMPNAEQTGPFGKTHKYTVPSATRASELRSRYDDRVRHRSESEFRLAFAVASVPPIVVLVLRDGWWPWSLAFAVAALAIADRTLLQRATWTYMKLSRSEAFRSELDDLDRTIALYSKPPPDPVAGRTVLQQRKPVTAEEFAKRADDRERQLDKFREKRHLTMEMLDDNDRSTRRKQPPPETMKAGEQRPTDRRY